MPDNSPSIDRQDSNPKRSLIDLTAQKRNSGEDSPSGYSSSKVSLGKQTEHYEKEWANPAERTKFMSRFKSFDITETSFKPNKQESTIMRSTKSPKMLKFPSISNL